VEGGRINPREKGVRSFHLFLDEMMKIATLMFIQRKEILKKKRSISFR
jgi:hypothetical protein